MKSLIMIGALLAGIVAILPAKAKVSTSEQCWFDYERGCDNGGWQACGICDDDIPPIKKIN